MNKRFPPISKIIEISPKKSRTFRFGTIKAPSKSSTVKPSHKEPSSFYTTNEPLFATSVQRTKYFPQTWLLFRGLTISTFGGADLQNILHILFCPRAMLYFSTLKNMHTSFRTSSSSSLLLVWGGCGSGMSNRTTVPSSFLERGTGGGNVLGWRI